MERVLSMRWLFSLILLCAPHALGQEASPEVNLTDSADFLDSYRAKATEKWEKAIVQLEQRDASEQDPADAILFIGSSSIRRWDSIAIDMAALSHDPARLRGCQVQRRGGVRRATDSTASLPALVSFVGNDVSGKPEDHTPDEVERLVRYIVGVSHQHQPDAPVLLIEVTPTEKRLAVWPQNPRGQCSTARDCSVDSRHLLRRHRRALPRSDGHPRSELFVDDQLHLNSDGYHLWSTLIRRRLDEVLRATEEFHASQSAEVEAAPN